MSLTTWFPEPKIVKTRGGEIVVTPVTLGKVPALSRAIAPLVDALTAAPGAPERQDWLSLIATHGDAVIAALALASGKTVAELEALTLDEAGDLLMAAIEVNLDFFMRRALPATTRAIQQLTATLGTSTPGIV